jgi:hypothetical protein
MQSFFDRRRQGFRAAVHSTPSTEKWAARVCLAGELCCTNVIVGAMGFDAGTCAVANNGACP